MLGEAPNPATPGRIAPEPETKFVLSPSWSQARSTIKACEPTPFPCSSQGLGRLNITHDVGGGTVSGDSMERLHALGALGVFLPELPRVLYE